MLARNIYYRLSESVGGDVKVCRGTNTIMAQ